MQLVAFKRIIEEEIEIELADGQNPKGFEALLNDLARPPEGHEFRIISGPNEGKLVATVVGYDTTQGEGEMV